MNKIYKIVCMCMISAVCAMPAIADEEVSVVERMDCASIQSKIEQLQSDENSSAITLAELQEKYRTNCMRRTGGRRTSGRVDAAPVVVDVTPEIVAVAEEVTKSNDNVAQVSETKTEFSAEQVAQFIADGKCADGTNPNKYGCCTGETFKDLGDLVFACCNADGECFPPIE